MAEDLARVPLALDALLALRARENPETPVMATAENGMVTAGDLYRVAGAAAHDLALRGIGPGDRVALLGQNSVAWIVWLCAAAWRGASIVALHPSMTAPELAAALKQSRPALLISDEAIRGISSCDVVDMARRGLSHELPVLLQPGGDGLIDLAGVLDCAAPAPPHLGHVDAPLNLQFTSGSTGRPKLVVLSHRALIINAVATARAAGIVEGDRLASPLPLVHAAGLSSGFILALAVKAMWCTSHRFRPAVTFRQIAEQRCTVFQAVPTMLKGLLDWMDENDASTPSLRTAFIGGAPCPLDLNARAKSRLGLDRVVLVYGQSEFGPTIALTTERVPAELAMTSVGEPLPDVEIRIVSPPGGEDVESGAIGEIWVRGRTLMDGYFEDVVASEQAVTADGWLRTGDLGQMVQGRLRVTGRLKELIIRGGENVAPLDVEDALRDVDGIADLVAVGRPSAHWGEEICLVVMPTQGVTPSIEALRILASERLAPFRRPDVYLVLPDFPLLPSGKIDRSAIRRRVLAEDPA